MKRLLVILSLLSLPILAQAQGHFFLFPDFVEGHIRFVNRSEEVVRMNFDALNQKVFYYEGETLMELTRPELISRVEVGERTFTVRDGFFCEIIDREGGKVLVNWKFKQVNVGSKGALGATTQAKVEVLNARSDDVQEIWKQKSDNTYFFMAGGQEHRIRRLKELYRAFPAQSKQLKAFAKANKLTMTNADDAFRLLDYLWSILPE